jgi:hypothetical protein
MTDLRVRAQRFLERPSPLGDSAADNLTDGFLRRSSKGGPWDAPDLHDWLRLCSFNANDNG